MLTSNINMKSKVIYTKLNRHRFMKELLKRSVLKSGSSKTCPLGLRCIDYFKICTLN